MPPPRITLFYDGACPLCSREIDHYRHAVRDGSVAYVDIADPGFDPAAEGFDVRRVNKHFHAKTADGRVFVGVDAFLELWAGMRNMRSLARIVRTPVFYDIAQLLYALFAEVRPLLPKRKACAAGECVTDVPVRAA